MSNEIWTDGYKDIPHSEAWDDLWEKIESIYRKIGACREDMAFILKMYFLNSSKLGLEEIREFNDLIFLLEDFRDTVIHDATRTYRKNILDLIASGIKEEQM